jgi:carboxyl-terminal processing protease
VGVKSGGSIPIMKERVRKLIVPFLGLVLGAYAVTGQSNPTSAKGEQAAGLPLQEIRAFTEVFDKIKSDYVEDINDKSLLESAIRGMLSGLDPHSTYLDPEAYQDLQEGTTGEFGGLGIEVGMEDGFIKVIAPIDDTPAQKAGIKPGDLIVRINDTSIKDLSLGDAVKMMRGKPGTDIRLTIIREGQKEPLKITITRAVVKVQSVKSRILEPHFGYIRISHFQSHTGEDLNEALVKLKEENGGDLKGLILDLRNNPGGILGSAVAAADTFLDRGLIVYTKGRAPDSEMRFNAMSADLLKNAPMVVLVNGGSASASEIVAGALQDHKRAVIMGSRTFGKGSVQTILPMNNNAALKLTTALYYTPSGRSIQAEGIMPDIVLDKVKIAAIEKAGLEDEVKEVNLTGYLNNGGKETKDKAAPTKQESPSLMESDYEIHEAINLLKGLVLLRGKSSS